MNIFKYPLTILFGLITIFAHPQTAAYEKFYLEIDSLSYSNKYDEAISLLTKRANELKPDTLNSEYVRNLISFGYGSYAKKKYKEANEFYVRAVEIELKLNGESFVLADCYLALGNVNLSNYHGVEYFLKAKKIFIELGYWNKAAQCYASLSRPFSFDIDKAPPIFFNKMAYRAIKKAKESSTYALASIERSMAISYMTVNDDSTEYYYKKAYKTIENDSTAAENYLKALCAGGVAETTVKTGKYDETEKFIQISYDLFTQMVGKESFQMAAMHSIHADLLYKQKQYDSALVYSEKALDIYKQYTYLFDWTALSYRLMSEIERDKGEYQNAIDCIFKALYANSVGLEMPVDSFIYVPTATKFHSDVQHRDNMLAMGLLYKYIYDKTHQYNYLQKSYSAFTNYLDFILNFYFKDALTIEGIDPEFRVYIDKGLDNLLEISNELLTYKYDVEIIKKDYNYMTRLKEGVFNRTTNSAEYNDTSLIIMLNKKKKNIDKLEQLNFKTIYGKVTEDSLDVLFGQIENLYIETLKIKTELKSYNNTSNIYGFGGFDTDQLLKKIGEDEVIVDYYYNDSSLFIFTLSNDTIELTKAKKPSDFHELVLKTKKAIKTGELTESKEKKLLSSTLFDQISGSLTHKKSLIVIPFSDLSTLPFEIFTCNGSELIKSMSVQYRFSSASVAHSDTLEPVYKYDFLSFSPVFSNNNTLNDLTSEVLVDDSSFRSTSVLDFTGMCLSPLPYTLKEVSAINQLFRKEKLPNLLLKNEQATKTSFLQNASDAKIVHIASHAYGSVTEPQLSGIFFSGETKDNCSSYLFLSELFGMNIKTNLVVLSACQSGMGTEQSYGGSISLPASFIYAGVPNVIASLWKVHDEKTKDLMVAFYKHLLEDKVSYAEALRQAKLDCIAKGFLPMDWAGFVLIGN